MAIFSLLQKEKTRTLMRRVLIRALTSFNKIKILLHKKKIWRGNAKVTFERENAARRTEPKRPSKVRECLEWLLIEMSSKEVSW